MKKIISYPALSIERMRISERDDVRCATNGRTICIIITGMVAISTILVVLSIFLVWLYLRQTLFIFLLIAWVALAIPLNIILLMLSQYRYEPDYEYASSSISVEDAIKEVERVLEKEGLAFERISHSPISRNILRNSIVGVRETLVVSGSNITVTVIGLKRRTLIGIGKINQNNRPLVDELLKLICKRLQSGN